VDKDGQGDQEIDDEQPDGLGGFEKAPKPFTIQPETQHDNGIRRKMSGTFELL